MRRINIFGKRLAAFCVVLCLLSVSCFADTTEDIETALAGQANAQYNVSLNAPFSKEQSGLHETVDPETGNMRVSLELFHYKVRGSLELDLSLTYSLSEARSQKHSFEYRVISCGNVNESFSPVELAQRNIAIGWSYQLPFVQKVGRVRYLNLPNGSTYRVDFGTESGLQDYELSDLVFQSGSFEQVGSLLGAYKLGYIDGTEYLFAENGLLLKKSDRYRNWIDYIWDTSDNSIRLSIIRDCTGREILFSYNELMTQITLEDRTYSFYKQLVSDTDAVGLLTKVSDPEGRETRLFYRDYSLEYTLADGINPISMPYYALSEIAYPTGLRVSYEYLTSRKGASSGYMDYLKLAQRFDEMPNGSVCNTQRYSYGGEPDAYPASELPNSYTYSTTVYSDGNKATVYAYDHRHLQLYRETSYSGVLAEHSDFEYDQNRFPTKTVARIYNKQGNYQTVTSETNYDRFGKLLSETTYDIPANRELYRKDYTYGGAYLLPLSTSYKQSASSNIVLKNILSRDEKSLVGTSVYENGICLKTDLYENDIYGNRITESVQRAENEYSTVNYIFSEKTGYAYPDSVVSLGVTDADGRSHDIAVSSEYDAFGNTLSATDGNGNTAYYTYDKLDRLLTETLPDGTVRKTAYLDSENTVTVTDGEGDSLIYRYDALGRPISVGEPTTGVLLSQKTYTEDGLLATETDALGTLYTYSYDIFRKLSGLTVSDDSGILTETHYDNDAAYAYGDTLYRRAVTEISDDKTLRRTEQLWDFRDRLMFEIRSTDEEQRITSYAYDYAGNAVEVISPSGKTVRMEYDAFGNKVKEFSGKTVNRYGYDLASNLLYQTNGEGETVSYAYDGFGKVVRTTTPYTGGETATAKTYYDNNGNTVKTVSAEGRVAQTEYDCRNRAVRSVVGDTITAYTYDHEGHILTQTQVGKNGGKTTAYTYDVFGNVKTVTDNLGQTAYYTYDAAGNLLKTIDRNQAALYNEYDGIGRVIRSYNTRDAGETRYAYNAFGEAIRVDDGGRITEYRYDGFGELVYEKTGDTVKEYAYNADGNRTLFRLSDGEHEEMRTEYAYDEQMHLKSVTTPIGKQLYTYDKANRVTSMLNENTGEETAYLYYPSGAVRNIIIKRNGKEVDRQYYEYDKDGNRTLEIGSGSVKQYTYDEQNRLKRCITDLNYITDYWYDEFNNITVTRTLSGGAAQLVYYEYDANNRLISSNDGRQTTTYAYDANGNMLRSDGEETTNYIFNGAGELAEVWNKGEVYTYEYDHTGLRIAKTVDGVTTEMITDGMYVVAEYTGTQNTYYYRGMNLIGYVANDEIGYYRFNAHGDVVAVVDTAGEIVTEYSYDPFGKLEDDENEWLKILFGIYVEDNNPFRYCAEYYDTETEFIYLRARYYSPDLQRFISEDPIRDGNNWYAYCGNNPIMIVDPQGCEAEFPRWEDMRVSKLILPSESKDDAENKIIVKRKQYVTAEQLIAIGWREDVVTNEMIDELNRVLEEYGITDVESIRHFITQVTHETDDWHFKGYGDGLMECGGEEYLKGKKYWPYFGAGYLHLTWKENYQKFYDYMKSEKGIDDPLILSQGPERIASTYAWESAGWFWTVRRPQITGVDMNQLSSRSGTIITKKIGNKEYTGNSVVFDVTYNVNGGYNGIENRLAIYDIVCQHIH